MKKVLIAILIIIGLGLAGYFVWDFSNPKEDFDDDMQSEKAAKGCEIVDDNGWVGIDSNVAVDKNDNPHISHYDQGNRDLKYARRMNKTWQNETVDSEGDVGEESGIAIDKDGNPHISYIDVTNSAVKYAKKINGKWEIKIVEQKDGHRTQATSIALDSKGNPHIVYNLQQDNDDDDKSNNGDVKSVIDDGDDMINDNLDNDIDDNEMDDDIDDFDNDKMDDKDDKDDNMDNNKMDNNKDDDGSKSYVKYAVWNGNSWDIETVTTSGSDIYLALDSDDIPHLSFKKEDPDVMDKNSEKITHATKINGKWKVEIADKETLAGGDTGIAVDSKNHPHIVYNDYKNKTRKYAYFDGSTWQTKTLFQDITNLEGIKIAVDNDDHPRVVFNDGKKETLMLAIWNGNSFDKKQADSMGNPSIAIDSKNRSHISYGHCAQDKNNQFSDIMKQTGEEEIEILKYCLVE